MLYIGGNWTARAGWKSRAHAGLRGLPEAAGAGAGIAVVMQRHTCIERNRGQSRLAPIRLPRIPTQRS